MFTGLDIKQNKEKIILGFFGVLIILGVLFYAYFVNQTILNIVERENIEEDIIALNSEISELEFDYINLKNDISLEYAYSVGFVSVDNVKFASRRLAGELVTIKE